MYSQNLIQSLKKTFTCYGVRLSPDMVARLDDGMTVENVGQAFAQDIEKARFPEPVYLVGFSFAAFFAFETARQLAMLGASPKRVWLLDMPVRPILRPRKIMRYFYQSAKSWLSGRKHTNLHRLGFLQIDTARHPESYRKLLIALYSILTRFKPSPWEGNANVVVCEARQQNRNDKPDLGWSGIISGEVKVFVAPGNHLSMVYDLENASEIAEFIHHQLSLDRPSTD